MNKSFLLEHKNAGEYISVLAYEFKTMSFAKQAKRALVTVLLELARIYGLDLNVNRLSPDKDVKKAFRKVIVKAKERERKGGRGRDAHTTHTLCHPRRHMLLLESLGTQP